MFKKEHAHVYLLINLVVNLLIELAKMYIIKQVLWNQGYFNCLFGSIWFV